MTSITTTTSFQMPPSPRMRMENRIAAAASAGTISTTDQTALDGALDSIDQSLHSAAADSATGGASVKDKIDGLIDAQVTSGTLTDAQASELKGFFAQGAPPAPGGDQGDTGSDDGVQAGGGAQATGQLSQAGGSGGVHHAHHHGGGAMQALTAALDGTGSSDDTSSSVDGVTAASGTNSTGTTTTTSAAASTSSSTTTTSSTDATTQQLDKLIAFLENMRASLASSSTYGASGSSGSSSEATGMVFSGIA